MIQLKGLFLITALLSTTLIYSQTVTVVSEDAWYPYAGDVEKSAVGISVDLVREAFKSAGVKVQFKLLPYDRGVAAAGEGQEVAVFNTAKDPDTEKLFYFPDEELFIPEANYYALSGTAFTIKSIKDLEGKKIGLVEGYPYEPELLNNPKIIKEFSKNDEICLKKLAAGRVDVIIAYDKVADYLISKNALKGKLKIVGNSGKFEAHIAFSKKNPDGKKYLDLFNKGFAEIRKNGTYDKIWKEWNSKLQK